MLTELITPLLEFLGIELIPLILLAILIVLIVKGD